jgi:electron transport complex protein RnfD
VIFTVSCPIFSIFNPFTPIKRGDNLSVQKRQQNTQNTVPAAVENPGADVAAAVPEKLGADALTAVSGSSAASSDKIQLNGSSTVMRDSLMILTVLAATAIFYYGSRAAALIAISLVTVIVTDLICALLTGKPRFSGTPSAIVTGFVNALILPSAVPLVTVIIGGIVSVALLRYCFGGREIINPSAGALLFLYYAFPGKLSVYVPIFTDLGTEAVVYPKTTGESFFYRLINSRITSGDFFDLLTGRLTSVMGGCVLIAIAAGIIYVIHRDMSGVSLFTAAGCFFAISFLINRDLTNAAFALAGVLPAMVFTALLPTAAFTGRLSGFEAKAVYGLLLGAVCAVFVWYSRNEYGGFFAGVILSPLAAYFGSHYWDFSRILPRTRRVKLSRK